MPTLTGVRWSIPFRINIWRKLRSAANTPNKAVITEEQYYSVNPYFFFLGVNAGQLQVNSSGQFEQPVEKLLHQCVES